MTIFERYVFRQAGGALLIILLSLSAIVWIALALRQLNVVTSQGQDVWMLVKMTTLALPNLMAIIAPFSLLIATIHTLNRLNSDSELIVLTASGATVWSAARPLIILSMLVALGVAFVNHLAMPWSMRLLRDYIVQVRTDILTQVIQPGQFSAPRTISPSTSASAHSTASSSASSCTTAATRRRPSPTSPSTASS